MFQIGCLKNTAEFVIVIIKNKHASFELCGL